MDNNGSAESILKVKGLTKSYGSFTAVDNLSFEVKKGEIFGFLGPNGAGKTTTINMIAGLLKPDAGDVKVGEVSVFGSGKHNKGMIGVCPQNITIWEGLTCIEQLEFVGCIYDMDKRTARERGIQLLAALGLTDKKDKLAKTLSGGMQRRLNIALALVHDPAILILDEPQAGLDPQSRVLVRDYIRQASSGMTVILTTHDMDEAEKLCDRIAIIDRGRLMVLDTSENLKKSIGCGEVLELASKFDFNTIIKEITVSFRDKAKTVEYLDGVLRLGAPDIIEHIPEIMLFMKKKEIRIEDMKIRKTTLEDVFIALTGRGLRE